MTSADRNLEGMVLDCVREHGPMSGEAVVAQIGRRRGDVLRALRSLRDSGRVRASRTKGDGRGTGFLKLWRYVESGPTPRVADVVRISASPAELEALTLGVVPESLRRRAGRALDRRRRRAG
jgi:hypothetical protein